jgi:hypothetical protein
MNTFSTLHDTGSHMRPVFKQALFCLDTATFSYKRLT